MRRAEPAAFRASERLAGRLRAWLRSGLHTHPHLAASLAAHGVLLAALWHLPSAGESERAAAAAAERARDEREIAQTQARELQQRVERMAQIARLLGEAAGTPAASSTRTSETTLATASTPTSPAALAAQAQALSARIDAAQLSLRAARLAKLTGKPLADATRELEAQAAAERPREFAATPAERIAQLERRATQSLAAQRAALDAQHNGVPVTLASRPSSPASASGAPVRTADGVPKSAADQLMAMTRLLPPQGRVGVLGMKGGDSVNPPGAHGVAGGRAAGADDTALRELVGKSRPFAVTGSSFDLTGNTALNVANNLANNPANSSADDPPYLRPPSPDRATLRTAAGRVLGAGGSFATRVYLDSWYMIGPFPGHRERTLETVYPPEEQVDLDGTYRGKGGRTLTWRYASRGFYPFVPPELEDRAVYFAYTELQLDEDRDVWLSIAADDDSMLWLDGRLIWKSEREDKPWYHPPFYLHDEQVASLALAEGHRRVHLPRGVHRLLLKLFNERDRSFFSVVLAP